MKAARQGLLCAYSEMQALKSRVFRFQFPNDHQNPRVIAQFPGAKHLAAIEQADATQQYDVSGDAGLRYIDLKKSKGNFFVDVDGNTILDLNNSLALGYNHDVLINARDSDKFDRFLAGNVNVTSVPPSDFSDILRTEVMPVAPAGSNQVHLSDGTSTQANETAISTALYHYAERNDKTSMYRSLSVLGFEGASHGQSVATLSVSDPAVNVASVPTFNWPVAPMPKMKYPLSMNEAENAAEEDRCI